MHDSGSWVIFSYRLVSETSTLRVRSWRILKRIGAQPIQNSTWVVPLTPFVVKKLKILQGLIEETGGEHVWLEVSTFTRDTEEMLIGRFQQSIAEEYQALVVKCDAFKPDDDISLDWESEMKELEKLLKKMRGRDYFECSLSCQAEKALSAARERFVEWRNTAGK